VAKEKKKYDPLSKEQFRLSRSSIDKFIKCPRCFYLELRWGIRSIKTYPYNLNIAVDELLKKEFDFYRREKKPHPLMLQFGVKAIPFSHPDFLTWRDNISEGVGSLHAETNFYVWGMMDDLWVNEKGELYLVDYKATSNDSEMKSMNPASMDGYSRQLEVYQWIFRKKGFQVSDTAYWVNANGDKKKERFDNTLTFRMTVISHEGNDDWVEGTLEQIKECLDSEVVPESNKYCDTCRYVREVGEREG